MCGLAIACFAASCAIGPVFVVLTCYVEWYFWAAVAILLTAFITAPIVWDMWQLSTRSLAVDDDYLRRWLGAMLMRHGMPAVVLACWCVYRIWKLDRVTFVEGVLVGELEVWMGHSFFWDL
jgi:GNAT superfamily N-acetyltransferase